MKKRTELIFLCFMLLGLLTACGPKITQKTNELVIGREYTADELFESDKDNVDLQIKGGRFSPEKPGDTSLELDITDGSKTSTQSYKFTSVDKTPPVINQVKESIVVDEPFDINDFIEVKDDVDAKDDITVDIKDSNMDGSKAGKYTVTVTAKDKAANQSEKNIEIEVIKPIQEVKVGETVIANWEHGEAELTIKDVSFLDEVKGTADNPFSIYYKKSEGEKYLVVKTTIKNLGGKNLTNYTLEDVLESRLKAVFDEKYEYKLHPIQASSSIMSDMWSIAPLKSDLIYIIKSVPEEVISLPFEVFISLGDDQFKYTKK